MCSQFADFINSGKDFSMNVMDSFLWIDFKISNGIYCVTIDVFDLERNQSNVKLTSQIEKEKVETFIVNLLVRTPFEHHSNGIRTAF